MGCMELSSCSCGVICVPIDLTRVSQGISGVAQGKPNQLSCKMGTWHCSEANEGNWSSFQVDLGYTELFHISAVTSVSF